jgi:hypothetical protein
MTEAVLGAVLLSAMRNEGPDVLEWVAFHRLIGFGKIVVYTNDCTDGSDDLFDALAALGWVEHHRHQPPPKLAPQDAVAALALKNPSVRGADWLLWIDADEFFNPAAGHLSGLIAAIGAADGIALNWRNFGDGGHDTGPNDLVLAAFTQAAAISHRQSRTVKTLHRMDDRVQSLFIHRPIWRQGVAVKLLSGSGQVLDPQFVFSQKKNARPEEMVERSQQGYGFGQINHYVIKALERVAFKQKRRGNGLMAGARSGRFGFGYLRRFNQNDEVDLTIQRHLPALRALIAEALQDPAVAQAYHACQARFAAMLADLSEITAELAADRTGAAHAKDEAEA